MSFRRRFPPSQSFGLVWQKLNLTQQKHTFTNQNKCTTTQKNVKPGLVAFYDMRPGNGANNIYSAEIKNRIKGALRPGARTGRKKPQQLMSYLTVGDPVASHVAPECPVAPVQSFRNDFIHHRHIQIDGVVEKQRVDRTLYTHTGSLIADYSQLHIL